MVAFPIKGSQGVILKEELIPVCGEKIDGVWYIFGNVTGKAGAKTSPDEYYIEWETRS